MGLVALGSVGLAAAEVEPGNAIAKLRQAGEVSCEPSLPFFCANMHVSCAGQTSLPTFPFELRVTPTQGSIESAPQAFRELYVNGRADWDTQGLYVIVHPSQTNGYIKLLSNGSYSFRHYSQHAAVMSVGRCN